MNKIIDQSITFDDVLLIPAASEVLPKDVDLRTKLTRTISLNIPIISAAMDTVTESAMAIAMAKDGGIGIIHKNLSIENQCMEVRKVKRSESGVVKDPITLPPSATIKDARELMNTYNISGIPITDQKKLVGILTNRDLRFENSLSRSVSDLMTKDLITAPEGITLEEAKKILHAHRIEKLPIVDADYCLKGMMTVKDIIKDINFPVAAKDENGRLRVGASVGAGGDFMERTQELINAGVDVIIIDTAHGHNNNVIHGLRTMKAAFPTQQIIAGNVATAAATRALIDAGADGIKVGIGPGSICTTRIIAGVGVPQLSAIMNCVSEAAKTDVPIIADGGIKYSGDIAKAIAAGAHTVMIGSLFAGTDESPGENIIYEGRRYKSYRGMGSISAMKAGSKDRYFQDNVDTSTEKGAVKLVAEGIEGRVEYKGSLSSYLYQLIGGIRSSMGYCGAETIDAMRTRAQFTQITSSGITESHPHDVHIVKEAPNYQRR